jgi:2-isopropylmalate synthase
MKKLFISDISMRLGGNSLSFKEKLEVAKRLDELKVDSIELAPSFDDKADFVLVRTIATFLKNSTLTCFAGKSLEEMDKAWDAMSSAKHKQIAISIPASFAQMEYSYHQKPDKVVEKMCELINHAKTLCPYVEVSFEDATRSDFDLLAKMIEKAIQEGATTITISDLDGSFLSEEYYNFLKDIYAKAPLLASVNLGIQCSNNLSLALSCVFSGIKAGAVNIKCSIAGGSVPKLEIVAQIISTIGDRLNVRASLNTTELVRSANRIAMLTKAQKVESGNKENDGDSENLNPAATQNELINTVKKRGYDLNAEDSAKVYEEYVKLAKKKSVNLKELDFIIASTALQVLSTYKLNNYVINSGNIIVSTASVSLIKDGTELYGLGNGDGPIDAAFKAIENITGHHFELDDFQIQAVTEGREAIGEALVKLRDNGKLYSGRGVSTDIIGASIKAYLNALNKIVYKE